MKFEDIDINIPYAIYCVLGEKDKFDIEFCVQYSNLESKDYFSKTPLEEREFGKIKELISFFTKGEIEEMLSTLFTIEDYEEEKFKFAPVWKVLKTLEFLFEKISNLMKIENEMLTPMVQDDKYKCFIEQVDFSMFDNEYTQVRELANGDITKFDEIRKQPYANCLVELIYLQKQNDLDRLIMNSHNK